MCRLESLYCSMAILYKLHSLPKNSPIVMELAYPPGIRFHPSDEELISYYLYRKLNFLPLPPNLITDIQLYTYNPWDLPRKSLFGENEWYFFTPRDRKYPKGGRPNRTTSAGYWKATGTDKAIISSCGSTNIGVKKGLVFYKGKPPNGLKMDWTMTEYRLPHSSRPNDSMRLDDWVLCRIRQKGNMSNNMKRQLGCDQRVTKYVQSSEHQQIVSLLLGHHQTIPTTATPTQENFSFFSHSSLNDEAKYAYLPEANNCKPTYPLNAYFLQNNTNLC